MRVLALSVLYLFYWPLCFGGHPYIGSTTESEQDVREGLEKLCTEAEKLKALKAQLNFSA